MIFGFDTIYPPHVNMDNCTNSRNQRTAFAARWGVCISFWVASAYRTCTVIPSFIACAMTLRRVYIRSTLPQIQMNL